MKNNILPKGYSTTESIIMGVGILVFLILLLRYYNQYKAYVANENRKNVWKSKYAECPDYWEIIGKNKCRNVHQIGKCRNSEDNDVMDFNYDDFTNKKTGEYMKCRWAKQCNTPWEGLDHKCS